MRGGALEEVGGYLRTVWMCRRRREGGVVGVVVVVWSGFCEFVFVASLSSCL